MTRASLALLAAVAAACFCTAPAHAGNELQLQFQRWEYRGGYARLQVSMRNNTMKPFASVVWACDLYDKQKRLVAETTISFRVVPWGVVVTNTQTISTTDQFQDGECRLLGTEPVTPRNERLYTSAPETLIIGNSAPGVTQYFDVNYRIQGRARVATDEENNELSRLQQTGQLTSLPGYRLEYTPVMKCRFGAD